MTGLTGIGWTDATWNPTRGCSRVSPGCVNCYAERQAYRTHGAGGAYEGLTKLGTGNRPVWTGEVRMAPERTLLWPLRWQGAPEARAEGRPTRLFVNSMSDLGHEGIADADRDRVLAVMGLTDDRITYQVLTKRAGNMRRYLNDPATPGRVARAMDAIRLSGGGHLAWPLPCLHYGVSVEDQATADERLRELAMTNASTRIVSYEPALGPVDFLPWLGPPHRAIDWLIVGGESGPGARPFDLEWARTALAAAQQWRVPAFMKQLGARPYDDGEGCTLLARKGDDPREWPEDLRVQQFPLPVNTRRQYLPARATA